MGLKSVEFGLEPSVVFPGDLDTEQLMIVAHMNDEDHRATADRAVLHQLTVAGGTVHKNPVGNPAPGAGDVSFVKHVE